MGMYSPTIVHQPGIRGLSSTTVPDDEAVTTVRGTPSRSRSGLTGAVMITTLGRQFETLSLIDTRVLTLSPQLHQALRGIAPRPRGWKAAYLPVLALVGVVAVLFADPSTREFLTTQAHLLGL
jgi:hypothetical protein